MLKKLHDLLLGLQTKVAGDPSLYLSVGEETLSVTFLWGVGGLSYRRVLSIYEVVQSNLTDEDYINLLIKKANRAYEQGLINIVASTDLIGE